MKSLSGMLLFFTKDGLRPFLCDAASSQNRRNFSKQSLMSLQLIRNDEKFAIFGTAVYGPLAYP
jgi:hypothetical protein